MGDVGTLIPDNAASNETNTSNNALNSHLSSEACDRQTSSGFAAYLHEFDGEPVEDSVAANVCAMNTLYKPTVSFMDMLCNDFMPVSDFMTGPWVTHTGRDPGAVFQGSFYNSESPFYGSHREMQQLDLQQNGQFGYGGDPSASVSAGDAEVVPPGGGQIDYFSQVQQSGQFKSSTDVDADHQQMGGFSSVNDGSNESLQHDPADLGVCMVDIAAVISVENSQARRGRCRFRDTSTWKCHVRKRLRNSGKGYNSRDGKVRREKLLKPGCGAKCRLRCHDRIPVEQREEIFQSYWKIGNLHAQRQFLVTHVTRNPTCRASKSSHHRKRSLKYAFHVDGLVLPVCKTFFLHTLSISQQMIETALDKITAGGHLLPDKRKQPKSRRIPENTRQSVRDHINKFQPVPSHYCRHSSTKTYLPETLSLSEMYRMYQSECQQNQTMPVKKEFYFSVFHKDFNIGFHKPKKDLCDFCETFARSSDAEKEAMQIRMDEHLKNKTVSRQLKEEMKLRALTDSSLNAACFDLQQVLVTPRSMSSQLYYRRKLATYNLTVYELATKQGHCFMWHEGVAKRGANNIASCLWKYINDKVACQCKEFVFFSDNCAGQNKNQVIAALYLHAIRSLPIDRITHIYMQAGHTQNEGDSMHAVIERSARFSNIFSPMQWYTLASTAKKTGNRYKVTEMDGQMMNFKSLAPEYCRLLKQEVTRKNPEWQRMKVIMVEKQSPHVLFVKYRPDEAVYVPFVSHTCPDNDTNSACKYLPPLARESTVSKAKKDDLLYMCSQLIIPKDYHSFYQELCLEKTVDIATPSGIAVSPSDADTVIRRSRRSLSAEQLQRSAGKTTTPKPRSVKKKSPSALSDK